MLTLTCSEIHALSQMFNCWEDVTIWSENGQIFAVGDKNKVVLNKQLSRWNYVPCGAKHVSAENHHS
jgi:hypothetical protein